jgi:small-conductance mechanosensitive channel
MEVDMDRVKDYRHTHLRNSIRCLIIVIALIVTIFVLSVSESTKLVLLGTGFVGVAIWARRAFQEDRKSESDRAIVSSD